jgi:hypothetical protein
MEECIQNHRNDTRGPFRNKLYHFHRSRQHFIQRTDQRAPHPTVQMYNISSEIIRNQGVTL